MSNSVSNTTITSAAGGGGRGSTGSGAPAPRGEQAGRGRGTRNRNRNNSRVRSGNANDVTASSRPPRASAFKGATEGMNGHTFGCFNKHSDKRQYVKTVEALDQPHATKTYKFPEDFASLFTAEPSAPEITKPKAPPKEGRNEIDNLIFKEQISKQYVNCCSALKGNLAAIWSVAIGQCTETMKAKLLSIKEYDKKHKESNCHWLLKSILSITLQFDKRRNGYLAIMDAYQNFLNCKQTTTHTVEEQYKNQLTLWSDTIEHHGGSIVVNYLLTSISNHELCTVEEGKEAARQETLAMALLRGADRNRFGTLLDHLANHFASGRDEYPKDLQAAYGLFAHYRSPSNGTSRANGNNGNSNGSGGGNGSNNSRNNERREAPATDESATTLTQHG